MRRLVRVFAPLFCVFLIVGCARPKDDNIKAFASATGALATFAKTAGDLNVELDGKFKLAMAAQASLKDKSPNLSVAKAVLVTGTSDADWKAVSGFLDAVTAYAEALAKANDPSLVTGLADKVTSIGSAISKVEGALAIADSAGQERIGAIGNIVGELVGIASNMYASIQIRESMAKAQIVLDRGRAPLQQAISEEIGRAHV